MGKEIKIVDTDQKGKDGTNRCPNCHASDVTYNIKKKKLICNYCYTEFEKEDLEGIEKEAKNLKGETRTTGVKDINKNANDIITLKCSGCGAEVVINTNEATNARCHWCRSILSINHQIDNGAIPDVVLPFSLSKEEAEKKISEFVEQRKFFANKNFKNEFTTKNIMGVYFPYMLIDANGHAKFVGEGEHKIRQYTVTVGSGDNKTHETRYDADVYSVEREFDISIDDLTIESSLDKLNKKSKDKTTNVINSIMPFDTENCVKYKGNYLEGFTSEKRDINISNIEDKVNAELHDVAKHALNKELSFYDRGVKWTDQNLDINGKQWVSAYLPVWLYSYQDHKKVLHYVAVNARSGETMGSVPIAMGKLFLLFALIIIAGIVVSYWLGSVGFIIGLVAAFIFIFSKLNKYRNANARHTYEKETKSEITNLKENDSLIKRRTNLSNSRIIGANNTIVLGEYVKVKEDIEETAEKIKEEVENSK